MSIKVFIADDHAMFRHGLQALLDRKGGFTVVGEAGDGPETVRGIGEVDADVLLLDLTMPGGMTGAEVAKVVLEARPRMAIVVLTMHDDEYYLRELLGVGARAFVVKNSPPEHLLAAIREAVAGRHYVDPALGGRAVSALVSGPASSGHTLLDSLSPREQEVCRLLALGYTNSEAAANLGISDRTVEKHRASIVERLQLKNRAELVRFAIDSGLLKFPR